MKFILHVFSKIFLLFIMVLMSGCILGINSAHSSTELSAVYSPYQQSAQAYLNQAQTAYDGAKQNYQLLAAGRFLSEGKLADASAVLNRLSPQNSRQAAEKKILLAKFYYLQHQAAAAIQTLAGVGSIDGLDLYFQSEYHELLALAYQAEQQYTEAALQRMKLDALLSDGQLQLLNRQKLWGLLQDMPAPELEIQYVEAANASIWKGWLKLAKIMHGQNFYADWEEWSKTYPNHPAEAIVKRPSRFRFIRPQEVHKPHKIGLILPFSGLFSGPAQAVKDGFMAAYQEAGSKPEVIFYDSNKGVMNQYNQAVQDGVDVLVGPLTKPEVNAIASAGKLPTLLLNDVSYSLPSNVFALGYSPKDEAVQLARMMADKGYKRVMMISPSNAWGQEISQAFSQEAYKHQMQIVEHLGYASQENFSRLLKSSLHYSETKEKNARGKETMIPYRRHDIDAIFLLAYPSVARQIIPLLKYYDAGNLPVYASSAAYDAYLNPSQDKDLDGLYFLDIPWVFNHQVGHRSWPEPWNAYSRLYALGFDAYHLTQEWSALQSMPQSGLSKQTGVLYIMPNGHIRRELSLGQIKQGIARESSGMWINFN